MRSPIPVLVLMLTGLGAPAGAEDSEAHWDQWRGPQRDGSAEMFGSLPKWPQAPTKVWEVPTGTGHASPVTDGERVYVFSRVDGDEVVAAFDQADGSEAWSRSYPVKFKARMGGGHHGAGPKSTPAVGAGLLVTFGITGVLSCWSTDSGEERWRIDFSERQDEAFPRWGNSLSPLIHEGRVYVHYGKDSGSILALDAATGEEIWSLEGAGASYASPVLAEIAGHTQLLILTADALLALDLEGNELWSHAWPQSYMQQNMATPSVIDDLVVIGSEKRPLTAVRPVAPGDGWKAEVAWERDDLRMDLSTATVVDDRLCGLSRLKKGIAFCIGADGSDVWLGKPRTGEYATVLATPMALLYLLADGTLVALDRKGRAYRELARYALTESETWAHPAVIEGGLIVKSFDRLARFDFR